MKSRPSLNIQINLFPFLNGRFYINYLKDDYNCFLRIGLVIFDIRFMLMSSPSNW